MNLHQSTDSRDSEWPWDPGGVPDENMTNVPSENLGINGIKLNLDACTKTMSIVRTIVADRDGATSWGAYQC